MDSTLIAAPSSTKNKEKQRDPEAHSVKKGNQWYFGYKEHIGVDADSGLVHTVETTSANMHDSNMVVELLQGTEKEIYGDSGYLGAEKKDDAILVQSGTCVLRDKENLSFLQDTIPRTEKIASALLYAVCTCEFIPCSQSNEGCVTRFISRANNALELRFFSKFGSPKMIRLVLAQL